MQKRGIWIVCLLALGVLAVGTSLRAQGMDEGKPMFIYVSQWAVPRAQWGEIEKRNDVTRALSDKLVADGTLTGYGEFANLIHQEGQPTHGDWMTADSEGKILKALEAFYAQGDVTAPVLAASKHWDYFLVSRTHKSRSGSSDGAYLSGSRWEVKPGQGMAFHNLLKSRIVPILDKLLADGTLLFYSVDTEDYHTQPPGVVEVVTATPDAAAMDKVSAAFEAAFAKDEEIGPAIAALTKGEGHRDFLSRITHMSSK
jgi:hypothetical protein